MASYTRRHGRLRVMRSLRADSSACCRAVRSRTWWTRRVADPLRTRTALRGGRARSRRRRLAPRTAAASARRGVFLARTRLGVRGAIAVNDGARSRKEAARLRSGRREPRVDARPARRDARGPSTGRRLLDDPLHVCGEKRDSSGTLSRARSRADVAVGYLSAARGATRDT